MARGALLLRELAWWVVLMTLVLASLAILSGVIALTTV